MGDLYFQCSLKTEYTLISVAIKLLIHLKLIAGFFAGVYILNLFHYFIIPLFIENSLLLKNTSVSWSHEVHAVDVEGRRTIVRKRASAFRVPKFKEIVSLSSPIRPYLQIKRNTAYCRKCVCLLKAMINKKKQCQFVSSNIPIFSPPLVSTAMHQKSMSLGTTA